MTASSLTLRIDSLLPQTQCTKCGYDGCLPYAQAMAEEQAPINRCPPGGVAGMEALARMLERPPLPLDPSCGQAPETLHIALIDELHCIGCTLCIQACPVDAIVGANQLMHTVLPEQCTGCELCVAPCPVDCIHMVDTGRAWTPDDARTARQHHAQRQQRLERLHDEPAGPTARTLANKAPLAALPETQPEKKQLIADVLAKARARRQAT